MHETIAITKEDVWRAMNNLSKPNENESKGTKRKKKKKKREEKERERTRILMIS